MIPTPRAGSGPGHPRAQAREADGVNVGLQQTQAYVHTDKDQTQIYVHTDKEQTA